MIQVALLPVQMVATLGEKLRVAGNLPYNISTPLLFHLVQYGHVIEDLHLMLQKEVVDRMAAQPGSKDFGNDRKLASLNQVQ